MQFLSKEILRYSSIGLVIFAIALLFPRGAGINLNYTLNEKWDKQSLRAPFEFSASLPKDKIESEKIRVRNESPFVYKRTASNDQLLEIVLKDIGEINKQSRVAVSELINNAFSQGVVNYIDKNGDAFVRLISDEGAVEKKMYELFSTSRLSQEIRGLLFDFGYAVNLSPSDIPISFSYDDNATRRLKEDALASLSTNGIQVKSGDIIISKGDSITSEAFQKLKSFEKEYKFRNLGDKSPFWMFIGYLLLTCLIFGVLLLYLKSYYPSIFGNFRKLMFILIWPLIFSYAVYFIEDKTNLSTYLIPFCLVPIIVKNFYTDRLALFVHVVVILIASFLSNLGYEFTFLQILAGIVTVLIVGETRYFNQFFTAIGFILLAYILGYLGLSLISEGNLMSIEWTTFVWIGFNAVLLLLAYPFIPILEKLFGFVSSITLAELSDLNKPLLQELTVKAPGTFQHSLQVSNLAEAATKAIGGDTLLVKVAALYHDVGKMKQPQYFIENQTPGESPHSKLNNFESAKIIIDHVTDGIAMAKKAGLPSKIINFISSHHGTTRVEYFYRNQLKSFPDQEFDESLFRYPGPKPRSKEETIMMIADSLEAASKSLKNPTTNDIDSLVDKIIAGKISNQQLDESALSFEELERCTEEFKKVLKNINHSRIVYPEASNTNA